MGGLGGGERLWERVLGWFDIGFTGLEVKGGTRRQLWHFWRETLGFEVDIEQSGRGLWGKDQTSYILTTHI